MSLRTDLYADITGFLVAKCDADPDEISEESDLYYDIAIDSLDLVAMTQTLQGAYDISMDDERIGSVRTVGDVLDLAVSKIETKATA
ncbi:phosphopantetheine-binding protein [Streptomyces sp. G-G2]|uniref:acyl carrier protein n=1 Tax=Streptomyces sp. G-G2 TaxID=3046201 RepID=UPI0024BB80D5|nr:phosphopantetheine-binding protein [Streptomyces sp. G-G2]MDJ0383502.1 phosphopantetheine-binding protein [Streptomyces sp. G-G2]